MNRSVASDDPKKGGIGISRHQAAAAAAPGRSIRELTELEDKEGRGEPRSRGNFQDFDLLFEQLAKPPVMMLGHPLPNAKHLPKRRAGSCHAAHNDALLRDEPD